MLPFLKRAVVLGVAIAPLIASAQRGLVIAGGVYEDHAALAMRTGFTPAANATVHVYRDGGDRTPSADDARVATAKTNAAGVYVVDIDKPGSYWVAVDSRTIGPQGTWAEQTFGPAGALCAQPDGTTRTNLFEGACFGGRTAAASDDASALPTSEHIAFVTLGDAAMRVDFAFSFDAVTSVADAPNIQGSFRQFLTNANAIKGPNRMRFVPLTPANEQRNTTFGVPPRWWAITLASPLPELRDEDTTIDGTAYSFLAPSSAVNTHPGRIGEPPAMKPQESIIPRLEKPELELRLTGAEGIVCAARCGIRALSMYGAPAGVILRADARIEHVLVGSAPDAEPAQSMGDVAVQIERGTTIARHLYATMQSRAGVIVAKDARLDAEHLDISRCGDPQTGAGIVLLSNGSSIRSSNISANSGAGIIIGSLDGSTPSQGNIIDGSTISSNAGGVILGPGSSRNVIARNDIMWNRLGGITVAPYQSAPPRENRISANRFDENGLRPIVLNIDVEDPNQLSRSAGTCQRTANVANDGIQTPQVTSVRMIMENTLARVTIRGRACAGDVVELYQSFVTSGVREEKAADIPRIRSDKTDLETMTTQEREMQLPSIGEFNYLGSASASADGTFEVTFPVPLIQPTSAVTKTNEETEIWASQVLVYSKPTDRAFSAIAIDAVGNTSEMSVRRGVDNAERAER